MSIVERTQGSIDAFRNHDEYKDNHRQTNNKETTRKHQSTDFLSSKSRFVPTMLTNFNKEEKNVRKLIATKKAK